MESAAGFWKKCNSCKREIGFEAEYWVCNVSTCNRKRTGLSFCSVSCWDAHLPMMNHREAWAEERRAPSREEWERTLAGDEEKAPRVRAPKPVPEEKGQGATVSQGQARVILRRAKE